MQDFLTVVLQGKMSNYVAFTLLGLGKPHEQLIQGVRIFQVVHGDELLVGLTVYRQVKLIDFQVHIDCLAVIKVGVYSPGIFDFLLDNRLNSVMIVEVELQEKRLSLAVFGFFSDQCEDDLLEETDAHVFRNVDWNFDF